MADGDKTLKLLIDLGVLGIDDAKAAKELMAGVGDEVDSMTTTLPEGAAAWAKYKGVLSETGEESLSTREKIHSLHFALESLGAKFPEMGAALKLLFNPATVGFAALSLLVESSIDLWDKYKEKLKEVAAEQVETMNKIAESANKAKEATDALNESLHPKSTTAEKDQEDLAKKIESLKTAAAQQKEINKANEDAALASATNDEQKAKIHDQYALQDKRIDELTQSQIAGFQSAAAEKAQKQIADIESKIAARKAELDAGNAQLQAEADEYKRQLKVLDFTHDPTGAGHAELSGRIAGIGGSIAARNDAFAQWVASQRSVTGDLGQFANKTQGDADQGQANSNSQRATDAIVLRDQRIAELEKRLMALETGMHQNFGQLLAASGKSQEQTEYILREIVAGHLNFATVVAELRGQIAQSRNTYGGG